MPSSDIPAKMKTAALGCTFSSTNLWSLIWSCGPKKGCTPFTHAVWVISGCNESALWPKTAHGSLPASPDTWPKAGPELMAGKRTQKIAQNALTRFLILAPKVPNLFIKPIKAQRAGYPNPQAA